MAEETREEILQKANSSLYFFAKAICGYNLMVAHLHKPVCDWLVETIPLGGRGLLMPRSHYKSTIVKAYTLWKLTKNQDMRVLFVGESETVACKNLNDVKWNIQANPLFQWLYPEMVPESFDKGWTANSIVIPRSRSYDEPTVLAAGVGGKITGLHFDLIVYDDIIGLEAARSPSEMQAAINWFELAPGMQNDPATFEEILVGTRWREGSADLYGWVMEKLPYRKVGNHREGFVWYIRSAVEDGKPIFPEKFSMQKLESIRKREGDYQFAAQFLNDPTSPDSTDFPAHWVNTYRVSDDRKMILLDSGESVAVQSLNRISFYDPSAGGRSAGSENAIVVVGMDSSRRIFCLEVWAKNSPFGEAVEQWFLLNDKWRCWANYFESIGPHKVVSELVKMRQNPCQMCGKNHHRLNAIPHIPTGAGDRSKEERIRSLAQSAFEEGRVFIRVGMDKLRKQITSFPHSRFVDLFDAFAYGISLLRAPVIEEVREKPVAMQRAFTTVDYGGYA
jgi:hypothetical protein